VHLANAWDSDLIALIFHSESPDFPAIKIIYLEKAIDLVRRPENLCQRYLLILQASPETSKNPCSGAFRNGARLEGIRDFSKSLYAQKWSPLHWLMTTFTAISKLRKLSFSSLEKQKQPIVLKAED